VDRVDIPRLPHQGVFPLEKRLTAAEARKLAAADHDLRLFGVSELTADVVERLTPHRHRLTLVGPCEIEASAARALAAHAGPVFLQGTRLDSPDLARKLLAVPRSARSGIDGVCEISAEVAAAAKALAQSPKWDGQLPAVTACENADSVAVAKALAKREGPLALPNLKKISPKTLTALIEKADVEIPLVETLELIPEPDGSPTEDFVIPPWLESRQKGPSRP
jgi:hypothetical protein